MDGDAVSQTSQTSWTKTKEAVANFRRLLLCSKCSNLMQEPVCLRMCEHMFCRSCVGSKVGDRCVVCHTPAWVKDIQSNRQLSSIIELFCGLERLLDPISQEDSPKQETPTSNHKKNFKIWFSPRSRKIRCMVESEKPSEVPTPESKPGEADDPVDAQSKDLSVFNFTSSSQDSGAESPKTHNCSNKNKRTSKKNARTRKASVRKSFRAPQKNTMQKMKRLKAINQQWGITEGLEALKNQPCSEEPQRASKRVSFVTSAVTSDKPQPELPQGSTNELRPGSGTISGNVSGSILNDQPSPDAEILDNFDQHSMLSTNEYKAKENTDKQDNLSPSRCANRRLRLEENITLDLTPKRPRTSPGWRRKASRCVLNSPSLTSPAMSVKTTKSPRDARQGDSPSALANVGRKSPCTSVGRLSSGSPAVMKRNHKGETLLHIAAIKGDAEAVGELLDQGADPNLKDNAGWTPLHEACNLGHLTVVEILVSRGALLNTPGYKNDSPLHDAVRNGHSAVVRLLLQLGASQNVLNLDGKRPSDYAASREMLEIFQEATEGTQNANTTLSPSVVSNSMGRDNEVLVVILSSKLSQTEQQQLAKLGQLLGARMADTFTESVSHVVVPDGEMPNTFSTLLGLLAGCWVVKYSWVEACLQAGEKMPEIQHEAGEGPQRSRINRCSLLPPLFDGCFFFLLGSFMNPTKEELTKFLRDGGGQLLSRKPKPDSDVTQTLSAAAYHAVPGSDQALCTQYILFDSQGPHKPSVLRQGKVWSAPSSWVIKCITAFRLLPVPDPQIPTEIALK